MTVSPAPVTSVTWSEPKIGMCSVGAPASKTAMPRLPRVMTTARIRVCSSRRRPARSSTRRLSSMRTPSACSTSDSLGAQASPAIAGEGVARVDEDRNPPRPRQRASCGQRRRDEARAVVGDQHGVGLGDRGARGDGEGGAPGRADPVGREPVDAHDLLLGRVDAAGEDARLHRRAKPGRPHQAASIDARRQRPHQAAARLVAADERDEADAGAERGGVGGGARAAGDDLGRVVREDQHRRLARDPRHAAVDVLVRDQVADHGEAPRSEVPHDVDHRVSAANGASAPPRITATAAIRLSQMASTRWPAGRAASWSWPWPVRSRIARAPTAWPICTSRQ